MSEVLTFKATGDEGIGEEDEDMDDEDYEDGMFSPGSGFATPEDFSAPPKYKASGETHRESALHKEVCFLTKSVATSQ